MADVLEFAIYGRRAGAITRDGGHLTLVYDDEYARDPDTTPLSLSMPLAEREHRTRQVEAYLRGLLPDHSDVRGRWAEQFGLRDRDTFGLIRAIGLDCAGGAIFAPDGELNDALARHGELVPVTEAEVARRLRGLRVDDADWRQEGEHWSLAGGQGKFTLVRTGDGWAHATGSEPSTHIVKPGISAIRAQALTEHVSMRTLALAGLEVASTEYMEFKGQPAIVVERFDRRSKPSGAIERIHIEDMVQTFGQDSSRKYEADQGPGIARISRHLSAVAGQASVERFADAIIANYLIGAPDAHAKNYSLLLAGRRARLAPLYDVASGLALDEASGTLRYRKSAMSIGGQNRLGEVEAKEWARFAGVVGIPADRVRDRVRELATKIPEAMSDAIVEIPAGAPGAEVLRSEILPRVAALAAHTVAGLDHSARVGGRIVAPYFDELRQVSGGAERDSRGADRLQRPPSGHVMARSARERELAPEPGRVWVEPHRRRGRTVEGHWRNIPGRRG